jgi:hypothetical protein
MSAVGSSDGGEAGVCAWRGLGDCGGLDEKVGSGGGCWLKCSGGSTLVMAGLSRKGACESGKERLTGRCPIYKREGPRNELQLLSCSSVQNTVAVDCDVLGSLYRRLR